MSRLNKTEPSVSTQQPDIGGVEETKHIATTSNTMKQTLKRRVGVEIPQEEGSYEEEKNLVLAGGGLDYNLIKHPISGKNIIYILDLENILLKNILIIFNNYACGSKGYYD